MSLSSNNNNNPEDLITLVKSPSVQRPRIPKLPTELHPLPPDISAYFVYPLSLEPYTLDLLPKLRHNANMEHDKHVNYLNERNALIESKKREEMKRVAPGWNGAWDTLEPSTLSKSKGKSVDDELVEGLERLAK
ncbi:hypothetical protein E3P92_03015 [Wallemia ichthyophaga]|uniref:Uncharacterized protein n=2 Tax=Wallemia ichthyophaga TaxID=245174 RepID=A0A4T0IRU5_WALIC|nr:uncharacterized protein J056_003195 [Wallemia ichthyophaga EXF-994]TIA71272.1 hypothetical protein E3P91_02670 [Wallemia ichthyophaga]EOQ98705.1 hypothetical protein J056_003195 [Wallemia ichthyophaga EXF-994]TIA79931.1 hypothetical protein E3P98_02969 [Wallemia ichthyophaga]TIA93978.1 hypothetical protein E3P97_00556 [Wallemia ichthyophaga]TIA97269.1 hypothetical protein E3P95_02925 [Wallemia ichthyophaga]